MRKLFLWVVPLLLALATSAYAQIVGFDGAVNAGGYVGGYSGIYNLGKTGGSGAGCTVGGSDLSQNGCNIPFYLGGFL